MPVRPPADGDTDIRPPPAVRAHHCFSPVHAGLLPTADGRTHTALRVRRAQIAGALFGLESLTLAVPKTIDDGAQLFQLRLHRLLRSKQSTPGPSRNFRDRSVVRHASESRSGPRACFPSGVLDDPSTETHPSTEDWTHLPDPDTTGRQGAALRASRKILTAEAAMTTHTNSAEVHCILTLTVLGDATNTPCSARISGSSAKSWISPVSRGAVAGQFPHRHARPSPPNGSESGDSP